MANSLANGVIFSLLKILDNINKTNFQDVVKKSL